MLKTSLLCTLSDSIVIYIFLLSEMNPDWNYVWPSKGCECEFYGSNTHNLGKRWKPLGQEEVRSVYERSPSPDIVPAFKMQEDKDAKKPKENVRNSPLISYPQSNSPLISFIHKVAPNKVSLVSNLKIQWKKELYLRLPKLLLQSGNEFSQKPQLWEKILQVSVKM